MPSTRGLVAVCRRYSLKFAIEASFYSPVAIERTTRLYLPPVRLQRSQIELT